MKGDEVCEDAPQVFEDPTPVAYRSDDRREVVVEQNKIRGFARDLASSLPHRHADVGLAQRRRIVDPVAGHRYDLTLGAQRLNDPVLLLGTDPGEDVDPVHKTSERGIASRVDASPVATGDASSCGSA